MISFCLPCLCPIFSFSSLHCDLCWFFYIFLNIISLGICLHYLFSSAGIWILAKIALLVYNILAMIFNVPCNWVQFVWLECTHVCKGFIIMSRTPNAQSLTKDFFRIYQDPYRKTMTLATLSFQSLLFRTNFWQPPTNISVCVFFSTYNSSLYYVNIY